MSTTRGRKRSSRLQASDEEKVKVEIVEDEGEEEEDDRRSSRSKRRRSSQETPAAASSKNSPDTGEDSVRVDYSQGAKYLQEMTADMDSTIRNIALNARQEKKWEKLPDTEKSLIVKAVSRLLLMKGTTNDRLLSNHVKDALASINSSYQVHAQAALREAQKILKDTFGYNVETVRVYNKKGNKESVSGIYVVNDLRSPALLRILGSQTQSLSDPLLAGYKGFCHIVFVSIWTSPGRTVDMLQLLRNMRKVDPRFSESLSEEPTKRQNQVSARSGSGIEELGNLSFLALVQRMIKEGYIKESKDEVDPGQMGKRLLSFGPRFFVEVGLKKIAKSYFIATGTPCDDGLLKELDRERQGYLTANVDEKEDDEDEGGCEETKE